MKRFFSHASLALLEGVLVAGLVAALMVGTAFAGKGGGKGGGGGHGGNTTTTGSIALQMVTDNNQNGAPNWNDQVTYDVSKAGVPNPFITTKCTQNGTNVLTTYAGYYPEYIWSAAQTVTLNTELWTGGAATCRAVVSNTTITLSYSVGG